VWERMSEVKSVIGGVFYRRDNCIMVVSKCSTCLSGI